MSDEQLKLIDNDASSDLTITHSDGNFMLVVNAKCNPHSSVLDLDRNQADMLRLYLQEHLK